MTPSTSDTDLVFADLTDALHDLQAARGSPKAVRQAFSRFVDLTQRITSAMRRDYSRAGLGAWQAKRFRGWNGVTDFFKWLRNRDQHEDPIRISVHERRWYRFPAAPDKLVPFDGTWTLHDQLIDDHDHGTVNAYPADPTTGQPMETPIAPLRMEYRYLVQPQANAVRARLLAVGTSDMHDLSDRCFATLAAYKQYFADCMAGDSATGGDSASTGGDPGPAT